MMAQLLLRYSKSRSLDELISSIRKGGHVNKLQAEIHYLDWDETVGGEVLPADDILPRGEAGERRENQGTREAELETGTPPGETTRANVGRRLSLRNHRLRKGNAIFQIRLTSFF